jgi:hypothetical protein
MAGHLLTLFALLEQDIQQEEQHPDTQVSAMSQLKIWDAFFDCPIWVLGSVPLTFGWYKCQYQEALMGMCL